MFSFLTSRKQIAIAGSLWVWLPLTFFLISAAWIWLGGNNMEIFRIVNSWSRYTGGDLWAFITILGDGVVSFAILLPWIRKRPDIIWSVFLAAVGLSLCGLIIKEFVDLRRPAGILSEGDFVLIGPAYKHNSFPSGHTAMIIGVVSVWCSAIRSAFIRIALITSGIVIGLSRVVVGVHWPFDVFVGAVNGWLFGWLGIKAAERTAWGFSRRSMLILGALMLCCCIVMLFPYSEFYDIIWHQRIMAIVLFVIGFRQYVMLWRGSVPDIAQSAWKKNA